MRALNRRYRGSDRVTDVLSFPQREHAPPRRWPGPHLLGDLVVCLPELERQARRYGLRRIDALAALLVHGTLHLLGYLHDRPASARRMAEAEMGVLAALGRAPESALAGRYFAG